MYGKRRRRRRQRSLQSAQSKDLVIAAFVYTRAPTKKVLVNKHTAVQGMTHFSSEYGSVKLGLTPARRSAWFIKSTDMVSKKSPPWGTKIAAACRRIIVKMKKRQRSVSKRWNVVLPSWHWGNIACYFNWLAVRAAEVTTPSTLEP